MASEENQQKQEQQPQSQPQPQKEQSQAIATPIRENTSRRETGPYRASRELARPSWTSSPFSLMERLLGDMGRYFEDFSVGGMPLSSVGAWTPQVDVFQREGNLVVHADLPGLRHEDVNVNIEDGVLTISGERRHKHEHESGGVYRCERSYGTFERSLVLPDDIEPESIQASFENGVLEVAMPMPKQGASSKARSIPIRSSSGAQETKH